MSDQLPVPAASNTFERIKRVNPAGAEFWSARELARVLEYTDFRNFVAVIAKAREACINSGHTVSNHFVETNEMVGIGSGAQREIEDWNLSRYACYLVNPSVPHNHIFQFLCIAQTAHNPPGHFPSIARNYVAMRSEAR